MEACYRHPDRQTGVACSSCGRPICPDCMTATQVGMRCPECAKQRTQVRTARSLTGQPTLTYLLIGINAVIFVGILLAGAGAPAGLAPVCGGTPGRALSVCGPAIADGEVWRLVTGGFVHSTSLIVHVLFNMFALYILGGLLEPVVGTLRFGLIYFVSLLSGAFGALLLSPDVPTVGASGAVFGLMGAALIVLRNRGISPMESGIGVIILINLAFTFLVPGISIGGHVGGLIGGALAALLLYDVRDRVRLPAPVASALAAGIGVLAVIGSLTVV
jgi:membrane associated rhomboid family serine protease